MVAMTVLFRNLTLSLKQDEKQLQSIVARRLRMARERITRLRIVRKSLDCRHGRVPRFVYAVALDLPLALEKGLLKRERSPVQPFQTPGSAEVTRVSSPEPPPVVVGSGPAGLLAAYRLAQAGCPPVVIERGPPVTERSKKWHAFLKGREEFDPECNLLYGEGGAGTYSDGKLFTRVTDSRVGEVLKIFAQCGAPGEILYDSHPHIGSNLLPSVVRRLREKLMERGVEFRFSTRMTDVLLEEAGRADSRKRVVGIRTSAGEVATEALFLAPGHSARDTLCMLAERGIAMAPKPFQMGVRVEHPQKLVDNLQYGKSAGHPKLPAAEYQMVVKRGEGDVFSFCMCAGGEILPATEQAGFICVNGASRYKRIGSFANSGFVVTLDPARFPDREQPLSGIHWQQQVESKAAERVGVPFAVPALRLLDFLHGRISTSLPDTSYPLTKVAVPFEEFLPEYVLNSVRDGLRQLGERWPGFLDPEALVVGPESRSSSPVRMLRDPGTHQSTSVRGLYPIGEGAGFAGGILSAAIDGLRSAECWLATAKVR
ncbi:MAG: FAD-binding protein [Planctomycetota bacterium]